jgi:hypothetical protein
MHLPETSPVGIAGTPPGNPVPGPEPATPAIRYRHTQRNLPDSPGLHAVLIAAASVATTVIFGAYWLPLSVRIPFVIVPLLIAVQYIFPSLTVQIDGKAVSLRYGRGLFRRTYPVARIAGTGPVKNPWYYGWGIRLTPHGMLYNISGSNAVEILFVDGARVRIGTDEPDLLRQAIDEAIGRRDRKPGEGS